jgi:hypothetical protein
MAYWGKTFKEIWLENIKREKKRLDFCEKKLAYWKRQIELSITAIEVDKNALKEDERSYGKKE